tara:strand:- start:99 stop:326 length:228 start_codon:yes stop_codon:yes gene_type:complete
MKKIFLLILIVFSIAFAVGNRQHVFISLWPIPSVIEAPLFLIIFISFALGALLGRIFNIFNKTFFLKKNKSNLNE